MGVFYLLPPFFPQRIAQGRDPVIKVHKDATRGVALCREGDREPRHSLRALKTLAILQFLLYHLILINKIIFLNGHRLSLSVIMLILLHLSALNYILWLRCYYRLRHSEDFLSPSLPFMITSSGALYPPSQYWLSPFLHCPHPLSCFTPALSWKCPALTCHLQPWADVPALVVWSGKAREDNSPSYSILQIVFIFSR